MGVEESDHSLELLEGLDQSVQLQSVKAQVMQSDAILMVFEKAFMVRLPRRQIPGA